MAGKRLFLSPPHLGDDEFKFVREAFVSNYIAPLGPMVDAFEREFASFTGIANCVALSSGTAAMHLALRELGVGLGDEVIASTLTFIGSVSPVRFLGASLAFVDSDPVTWSMDPGLLWEELKACARRGKLPKAVIPTDLYGQCCDLPKLRAICDSFGVPIVVDSAEAVGSVYRDGKRGQWGVEDFGEARSLSAVERPADDSREEPGSKCYRHAGYGARAAVFSFNGNKIITTSGGGMLASEDSKLIEHARKLAQQAREPAAHYEHVEIGYNYRMSNVLAAIGRGQLRVLDHRVRTKRWIAEQYEALLGKLPGVRFMSESTAGRSNRWLTVMLIDVEDFGATPDDVRIALETENIESRPVWKPMHLQPVFEGYRIRGGAVSERLFRHGLCLPSGTAMTIDDIERVADVIRRCAK